MIPLSVVKAELYKMWSARSKDVQQQLWEALYDKIRDKGITQSTSDGWCMANLKAGAQFFSSLNIQQLNSCAVHYGRKISCTKLVTVDSSLRDLKIETIYKVVLR